ncbi:MAG: putative signal peptide protein [Moraxellaceae bacterium]|nr:putative signal peptide protein [Moraxellaceae bacterium]
MRRFFIGMALVTGSSAQAELAALDNEALAQVSGMQGVAIGLDMRLNADAGGTPLPLCTAAATYRECRVSWSFSNRGSDDVDKKWLVLKGFTGAVLIPYLRVDASSITYDPDGAATTKSIPAVLLGFGDATGSGANTKVQVKNLIIDNIAMEQDTATRRGYEADATTEPTGAAIPANVNTGFMGLQISGPGNVANVQIDGTVKLYSCLGDHPSC